MDKEVDLWIRRAKSSLIRSKMIKTEEIFYEDMCFDTQQSAEKSLKALIIHLGLIPHKTHSFRKLLGELSNRFEIPESIKISFET